MHSAEKKRLASKVASMWLKRRSMPSVPPAKLPCGLVSALKLEDLLVGMDSRIYQVTSVGPGGLVLEVVGADETKTYLNNGYGDYAWAYFAAPELHWLITS